MRNYNRTTIAATMTAAALLAGCAGGGRLVGGSSGGAFAGAGGTFDLSGFTEGHLMQRMIVSDSLEAQIAQLAVSRTSNAAVRDFAKMIAGDHSRHMQSLVKLAGRSKIGRVEYPGDSSAVHAVHLRMQFAQITDEPVFNRTFVREEITEHAQKIATLRAQRTVVRDAEFEKAVDQTIPLMQRHLAAAQALALRLGVDTTSTWTSVPSDVAKVRTKSSGKRR